MFSLQIQDWCLLYSFLLQEIDWLQLFSCTGLALTMLDTNLPLKGTLIKREFEAEKNR